MSITLAFVTFGCETNFGKLGAFVFDVPFKTLALDVIPMWGVLGTRPIKL